MMTRSVARCVRLGRRLGPIECGIVAGVIASSALFSTRLVGDDLAALLFRLSHGG